MKQKRKKRKSPKNSWAQANQRTIYTEKPRGDLQLGREDYRYYEEKKSNVLQAPEEN